MIVRKVVWKRALATQILLCNVRGIDKIKAGKPLGGWRWIQARKVPRWGGECFQGWTPYPILYWLVSANLCWYIWSILSKLLFLSKSTQKPCRQKAVPGRGSCQSRTLPLLLDHLATIQLCTRGTKISLFGVTLKNQDYCPTRTKSILPAWTTALASPSYQSLSKLSFQAGSSSSPIFDTCY